MIRFLSSYPALSIPQKKILVISDLHIGLEHELYQSGIIIPSQAEKFQKIIDKLLKLTGAKALVILGDIKHKVPGTSFRELKEIPRLLNSLKTKVEIALVRGNHDTDLKWMIPKWVKIHSSGGFKLGIYGFFHGHAWPNQALIGCDYLFMGHVHPAIEFKDRFGFRSLEPIWVRGKLNKKKVRERYKLEKVGELNLIIMPTFNKILGGLALNSNLEKGLIGPLLTNRLLDIDRSEAYMLDGTHLGSIRTLRK
jgi:hypothetical protein